MARRFGIACWRCWSNPRPQARRRDGPALTKHGDVIVCATTACLRARLRTAPIRSLERQRADAQLLMTLCLARTVPGVGGPGGHVRPLSVAKTHFGKE